MLSILGEVLDREYINFDADYLSNLTHTEAWEKKNKTQGMEVTGGGNLKL